MPGVVFFGYGDHGATGLELLAEQGASVAALVVPWNRHGSELARVTSLAGALGVPVLVQPRRRDLAPFLATLRAAAPDVILVWSYSLLLPASVLTIPRHGAVNVHGGLLPEYRGGHVKQWALINGESESGVTLHIMDEGVDTGPVIAQERVAVAPDDDFRTLGEKLKLAGRALLRRWLADIVAGTAPRVPQDPRRARHWPMRTPEQGRIEWTMTAESICRLTRALVSNRPGAFVDVAGRRLSVRRATALPALSATAPPGELVALDGGARMATANGDVLIAEVEDDDGCHRGERLAALFR